MLEVRYAPEIEDDLAEAALRYVTETPSLGAKFLEEFRDVVKQIAAFGRVYRQVGGDYRRLHLARFPYVVYFVVQGDRATIYLVIDATRDPALVSHLLRERH